MVFDFKNKDLEVAVITKDRAKRFAQRVLANILGYEYLLEVSFSKKHGVFIKVDRGTANDQMFKDLNEYMMSHNITVNHEFFIALLEEEYGENGKYKFKVCFEDYKTAYIIREAK